MNESRKKWTQTIKFSHYSGACKVSEFGVRQINDTELLPTEVNLEFPLILKSKPMLDLINIEIGRF